MPSTPAQHRGNSQHERQQGQPGLWQGGEITVLTTVKRAGRRLRAAITPGHGDPRVADSEGGLVKPSLITGSEPVPSLTLVFPDALSKEQLLAGLADAVRRARRDLTINLEAFQWRMDYYAAQGDHVQQALCRGQVLGADNAIAKIDEAIIEAFGLWAQYDTQVPPPATPATPPPTSPVPQMRPPS
jgi:hypothetical protein